MVRSIFLTPALIWLVIFVADFCHGFAYDAYESAIFNPDEGNLNIIEEADYEPPPGIRLARDAPKPLGVLGYYKCKAPDGYPGLCKPRATCASYYSTSAHYDYERPDRYKSCNYGYGYRGVCCPEVAYSAKMPQVVKIHYKKRPGYDSKYAELTPAQIHAAVKWAEVEINGLFKNDKDWGRGEDDDSYWGNGVVPDVYLVDIHKVGWAGFFISLVTVYLTKEYGYNPAAYYDGGLKLNKYMHLLPYDVQEVCKEFHYKKCAYSKYRTMDGSCNNVKFPYWGQARSVVTHLAVPVYADKIWAIKRAYDNAELPPARALRFQMLPEKDIAQKEVNMLFVNWGQITVHDSSHTIFYQGHEGDFLDCCNKYNGGYQQALPKCYAMALPPDDPFYSHHKQRCLNLARIAVAPNYQCAAGYASQMNYQTALLDLSLVYHHKQNESDDLRTGKYGTLKMSKVGAQYYLPIDPNAECFNTSNKFCMKSGDLRTTLHPGITLIQTILARFHNYCAKKIYHLNPHWDDEKIFQECRKLNIAVYQHITYNEYLPLLLGWKFLYDHGLLSVTNGYSYDYDEYTNPAILAEFTGAAMRCHSTVYGKIALADEYYNVEKLEPLNKHYNDPSIYKNEHNFDKIARGYIATPQRRLDPYYDPMVSLHMLQDQRTFGLDIGTMNIHRGRDYALRSYNDYREMCGLKRAYDWKDFYDWIDPQDVDQLRKHYKTVNDVELYAAGLMEKHQYDALVGPTWWCIMGQQFKNWKSGDRYFYDLGDQPHSFTLAQLDQIRHISLAALLCTVTGIKHVPAFAFHTVSDGNPLISCDDYESIPRLQFGPWKATKYY